MRNEILDYFRKANGQFISGEQISRDLHVSRTAIWKHINILKERGYIFESSTHKGYRLIYAPNLLTPLEIDSALHTETFGRHVVYLSSTTSTNEEAKKIAREGAEEGTIVVAEEQTGGRGRLTRSFYCPFAKGIWFTLILRPKFFPMEASKCTLMAAVGVCRGIRRLGLQDAGIKWPNDILYHGKKLVGILTEMSSVKVPPLSWQRGSMFPVRISSLPFWRSWRRSTRSHRHRALTRCLRTGKLSPSP